MVGLLLLFGLGMSVALIADGSDDGDGDGGENEVAGIDAETAAELVDEEQLAEIRTNLLESLEIMELEDDLSDDVELPSDDALGEEEGTPGDDLIRTLPTTTVTFGYEGNDTIIGNDETYENIFGDEGDDQIFGEAGTDLLLGGTGDDLIAGGPGDDEILGQEGTDTIFGGPGNDLLFDAGVVSTDQNQPDVGLEGVSGGEGNDQVRIEDGVNVVSLGAGSDALAVANPDNDSEDHPIALVTDFDPAEDVLVLGVHSSDPDLISENTEIIGYSLFEIETSLGPATAVVPAVNDAALADDLSTANIGIAILQGVTPSDLQDAEVTVVLTDGDHSSLGDGNIGSLLRAATA